MPLSANIRPATKIFKVFIKNYTVDAGRIVRGFQPGGLDAKFLNALPPEIRSRRHPFACVSNHWEEAWAELLLGSRLSCSRGPAAHPSHKIRVRISCKSASLSLQGCGVFYPDTHLLRCRGHRALTRGGEEGLNSCQRTRGRTCLLHGVSHGFLWPERNSG